MKVPTEISSLITPHCRNLCMLDRFKRIFWITLYYKIRKGTIKYQCIRIHFFRLLRQIFFRIFSYISNTKYKYKKENISLGDTVFCKSTAPPRPIYISPNIYLSKLLFPGETSGNLKNPDIAHSWNLSRAKFYNPPPIRHPLKIRNETKSRNCGKI